jgi:hypothetical protein
MKDEPPAALAPDLVGTATDPAIDLDGLSDDDATALLEQELDALEQQLGRDAR